MDKDFDDVLAKIEGTTPSGNKKVNFDLTGRDIKHIRRVLEFWDFIHPNLQSFDTNTIRLYDKFKMFGHLKRDQAKLHNKMKDKTLKCSHPGCDEKINLTIHHINGKRGKNVNAKENLDWFCPKHHLLEELNNTLETKYSEIEKVKERINKVINAEKTDMLGYKINKRGIIFNGFSEENNLGAKSI